MAAFIQNFNGEIGVYDSSNRELIKGGFASVKEAREWADTTAWHAIWVVTHAMGKPAKVQPETMISRLERAKANCK